MEPHLQHELDSAVTLTRVAGIISLVIGVIHAVVGLLLLFVLVGVIFIIFSIIDIVLFLKTNEIIDLARNGVY